MNIFIITAAKISTASFSRLILTRFEEECFSASSKACLTLISLNPGSLSYAERVVHSYALSAHASKSQEIWRLS